VDTATIAIIGLGISTLATVLTVGYRVGCLTTKFEIIDDRLIEGREKMADHSTRFKDHDQRLAYVEARLAVGKK
jgi:hypothetical protein